MTKILTLLVACFSTLTINAEVAKIQAGDTIQIDLSGIPNSDAQKINGVYSVDDEGRIIGLPYLDNLNIEASGLTQVELAEKISSDYKKKEIYKNPIVTARLINENQREKIVTVGGRVNRPGQIPYREGMTILDAVRAAGGNDRFGDLKRVSIIRRGKTATYNLGNGEAKRITLLPFDTLSVEEKMPVGR